ncbi:AEC family transporter [Mesorhizobium sp. Z1-4]|uniref:AEC family transporter n=1 Tax=Mesorhizobium sp. Z1-4 TaxID=2448478 RepID=UPI000FD7E13D|nr:AEC family transporter [Mesorhizobium sp. Z1-4]
MLTILVTVAPVFILILVGYAGVRSGYLPPAVVDALNAYAVKIAVPVLLFRALERLDLAAAFSPQLLTSFYAGAFACFAIGILAARHIFKRRPGEAVAVGFAAMFSNTVLLGLAILERSQGPEPLTAAFGIIAFHAPLIYAVGILTMEFMRRDGRSFGGTLGVAGRSMLANPLMIGILAGAAVNVTGHWLPEPAMQTIDMIASTAIPVALVGIGASMTRYRLGAGMGEAGTVAAVSLIVHPAITFVLAHHVFALGPDMQRAAVILAAMPPGMNIYLFAVMYDRAVNLAASAFLLATMLSVLTATFWIYVLDHAVLG